MRICPKCKESVGESLQDCPLCNYHFTDEDNERFRKEKEEIEHGEAKQMELLRASRAKKRVIYAVLMMGLYILPYMIGGSLSIIRSDMNAFVIGAVSSMVLGTVVMITGLINGAFRCPYCDRILFLNYGKHCLHCGKQLYY